MEEKFDIKKAKIKIILNQKGDMLAQVELRYSGLIIIGFRVMRSSLSEDSLRVVPPSVRCGSKYLNIVRIEDKDEWRNYENSVKNAYLKEVKKYNESLTGDIERGIVSEEEKEITLEEVLGDEHDKSDK
ncbi:hypothetical protein JW710_02000 [Candidatus Dojkabacteria bacterium]|nr:hypothetical protein [Candidatus Dojkabacteria bacterium]